MYSHDYEIRVTKSFVSRPREVFERNNRNDCITQRKPLVENLKKTKIKDNSNKFAPTRKIRKLHEDIVKSDFTSYIHMYINTEVKMLLLKFIEMF